MNAAASGAEGSNPSTLPEKGDLTAASARSVSLTTGVLFIVATVAALAADVVKPALDGADDLAAVADNPTQLAAAVLIYLIAAGTSVGIAIALYPFLKQVSAAHALGSVVFEPSKRSFTRSQR